MNRPPARLPGPLLVPSDPLRARLTVGVQAALIAGGFSAAAGIAELVAGGREGLAPARVLGLIALIPSAWIAVTYAALGREAGRPSLGMGAWGVVGAGALVELGDLANEQVLPGAGQALLRMVIAIGLILLPVLPLLPDARVSALVAAAILACAAQVRLAIGPSAGAIGELGVAGESIADFGAVLLLLGFFLWFGASKIRSRRELGDLAAVLGWLEIVGFLLSMLWVVVGFSLVLAVSINAGDLEPGEKLMASMEGQIDRGIAAIGLFANLAWAWLTAWLFRSIRRRGGADPGASPEIRAADR